MAERQSHGFKFEVKWCRSNNAILWKEYEAKYGKQYNGGYTSKWDAIDENKVGKSYKGRPIQIKCIGINNAIELGDIFRNSTKEEDFRLIVGFWNGIKTNIHQTVELEINHKKWNKLFGLFDSIWGGILFSLVGYIIYHFKLNLFKPKSI